MQGHAPKRESPALRSKCLAWDGDERFGREEAEMTLRLPPLDFWGRASLPSSSLLSSSISSTLDFFVFDSPMFPAGSL